MQTQQLSVAVYLIDKLALRAGGEKDDAVQRMVALRVIIQKVLVEFRCVESMLTLTTRGNTEEDLLSSTGEKAMLKNFLRNVADVEYAEKK